MAGEKKLESPVTLFAAIEAEQHAALREIAYTERRSLADVVREALSEYLRSRLRSVARLREPRARDRRRVRSTLPPPRCGLGAHLFSRERAAFGDGRFGRREFFAQVKTVDEILDFDRIGELVDELEDLLFGDGHGG